MICRAEIQNASEGERGGPSNSKKVESMSFRKRKGTIQSRFIEEFENDLRRFSSTLAREENNKSCIDED